MEATMEAGARDVDGDDTPEPLGPWHPDSEGWEERVWRLVVDNERLLRRETRRHLPRHRRHEFENLYSDVVVGRAHSIMRNYRVDHPSGARPLTYLTRNCKWYAMEWAMGRKYKRVPTPEDLSDGSGLAPLTTDDRAVKAAAELRSVLDLVPPLERWLLVCHHVKGFDADEIAAHLGVRRRDALEMLNAAMFVARVVAADEVPE